MAESRVGVSCPATRRVVFEQRRTVLARPVVVNRVRVVLLQHAADVVGRVGPLAGIGVALRVLVGVLMELERSAEAVLELVLLGVAVQLLGGHAIVVVVLVVVRDGIGMEDLAKFSAPVIKARGHAGR